MLQEIEYTKETKEQIISEQKAVGGMLKEIATRLDGRQLLIFEMPDVPQKSALELRIEALESKVTTLESTAAEVK